MKEVKKKRARKNLKPTPKENRGLSARAAAAIKRYSELIEGGDSARGAIEKLKEEGFKTRNDKEYSSCLIRSICTYSGVKLPKMKSYVSVVISQDELKKAMILCFKYKVAEVADTIGYNRQTLRTNLMARYPHLWVKRKTPRIRMFFLKTSERGFFEVDGFLFDNNIKSFISLFKVMDNGNGYAKISRFYAHRVIAGAPKGFEVDHINGNKKDNRRENLRLCNRTQNAANKKSRGYTEIKDRSLRKRFAVNLEKRTYFKTKEEAADAFKKHHAKKYGEFSPYSKRLGV
jgi:hypothetical protein